MQIQLTQSELKEAVRLYVTNELNIGLDGKVLTIGFTATRGDLGVITNLSIDKIGATNEEIPGYTNASAEVVAQANAVTEKPEGAKRGRPAKQPASAPIIDAVIKTTEDALAVSDTPAVSEPEEASQQEDAQVADSSAEEEAVQVEAEDELAAPVAKTTSLFG